MIFCKKKMLSCTDFFLNIGAYSKTFWHIHNLYETSTEQVI